MTREQLKDRVNVRRHELMARLTELQADARNEAAAARDIISMRLYELDELLKDGWDDLSTSAAARLDRWLERN